MEGAPEPGFSDAALAPYTVRGPVLGQCFQGSSRRIRGSWVRPGKGAGGSGCEVKVSHRHFHTSWGRGFPPHSLPDHKQTRMGGLGGWQNHPELHTGFLEARPCRIYDQSLAGSLHSPFFSRKTRLSPEKPGRLYSQPLSKPSLDTTSFRTLRNLTYCQPDFA